MSENHEIKLSPDDQAVVLRTIRDIQLGLQTLDKSLQKEGSLNHEIARNVLSVTEYNIPEIGQKLGVATETEAKITKRHADIRAANLRIRDLESQLGSSQAPSAVQMSLGVLTERLHEWWRIDGFGHVSEESFGRYGCKVKLSCHLFGDFSPIQSETPISDKDRWKLWLEQLKAQGFMLGGNREKEVIDCDSNRKLLIDLISDALPSSKVISFSNHFSESGFKLRDVDIIIYKLDDILNLPQMPQPEKVDV